jgi:uncharacterized protein (TIGR02284 family)
MLMSQRLNNLNELIAVVSAGAGFYRKAARQTDRAEAEAVYRENADLRERISLELSRVVDEAGHEPAGAAPTEQARSILTRFGTLFDDKEEVLTSGLERHEERTIDAFRTVIHHRDNAADEQMLRAHLSEIEKSHARLRSLGAAT